MAFCSLYCDNCVLLLLLLLLLLLPVLVTAFCH
jgi:hypothetical protein